MSGTSADGIDVALARIAGRPALSGKGRGTTRGGGRGGAGRGLVARLLRHTTIPYPAGVREAVLRIASGAAVTTAEISQLNFLLGELFARAAMSALGRWKISERRVALIGSHGQTVFHQGAAADFLGSKVASTLQLGHPAVIAAETGITTIGDFRPADMAAGGQGAPLVPFVDYLLYRHARRGRVALNIGGIANVTVIPAGARAGDVFAFDTGPGNMLLDALAQRYTGGKQMYDASGAMARGGKLLPGLLDELLADDYFARRPPKSAGREQFGPAYVERIVAWAEQNGARPEDVMRTMTSFTALTIADAFRQFVAPAAEIHDVVVSGGGARNPVLMSTLQLAVTGLHKADVGAPRITSSAKFAPAIPVEAKEAFAFAILAYETWHGRAANLPSATGARRPAILGAIAYAPPR